jgi:hypothetical protein
MLGHGKSPTITIIVTDPLVKWRSHGMRQPWVA